MTIKYKNDLIDAPYNPKKNDFAPLRWEPDDFYTLAEEIVIRHIYNDEGDIEFDELETTEQRLLASYLLRYSRGKDTALEEFQNSLCDYSYDIASDFIAENPDAMMETITKNYIYYIKDYINNYLKSRYQERTEEDFRKDPEENPDWWE